jgi:hypothetical protein
VHRAATLARPASRHPRAILYEDPAPLSKWHLLMPSSMPANRFWSFQKIEACWLLVLSVILSAAIIRRLPAGWW